MHEIVLDTNVLVAALRSSQGSSHRLPRLLGDPRFRLNVSVPVALEYEDVLKRDFMHSVIDARDVDDLLDYLFKVSRLVEVRFRLRPSLPDADDERILELAAHCQAMIITFNVADFRGAEAYRVPIMRPADFLLLIGEFR